MRRVREKTEMENRMRNETMNGEGEEISWLLYYLQMCLIVFLFDEKTCFYREKLICENQSSYFFVYLNKKIK